MTCGHRALHSLALPGSRVRNQMTMKLNNDSESSKVQCNLNTIVGGGVERRTQGMVGRTGKLETERT